MNEQRFRIDPARLALLAGVLCLLSTPLAAQTAEETPPGGFTFKRIGVPGAGEQVGRRITVQVAPRDNPAQPLPPPALPQIAPQPASSPVQPGTGPALPPITGEGVPRGELGWFWDAVSPSSADSRPGRLFEAVHALRNDPQGRAAPEPRVQALQPIIARYGATILRETVGTPVSPALVLAVIIVESAGKSDAVSRAGAMGLMQLMPATAERFGVTDAHDPAQNIAGGVAYLTWLMEEFDGDPVLFLAAYNAGEGNVRDHGGVPPFAETRDYVPKVLSAWLVARALCATPPELLTDGCVFAPGMSQ